MGTLARVLAVATVTLGLLELVTAWRRRRRRPRYGRAIDAHGRPIALRIQPLDETETRAAQERERRELERAWRPFRARAVR